MKLVGWSDIVAVLAYLCIAAIIVWFKWKARMYPHQILEDALRHYKTTVPVYCVELDYHSTSTDTHYGVVHRAISESEFQSLMGKK